MTKFANGNQAARGKGRPKRSGYAAMLDAMLTPDDVEQLLRRVHQAALDGDMQAAGLLINRLIPTLKPTVDGVRFNLPEGSTADQARAIVSAIAAGKLSVMDGRAMLGAMVDVAKIVEATELESRISALEAL